MAKKKSARRGCTKVVVKGKLDQLGWPEVCPCCSGNADAHARIEHRIPMAEEYANHLDRIDDVVIPYCQKCRAHLPRIKGLKEVVFLTLTMGGAITVGLTVHFLAGIVWFIILSALWVWSNGSYERYRQSLVRADCTGDSPVRFHRLEERSKAEWPSKYYEFEFDNADYGQLFTDRNRQRLM